jgi:hypothetical protein
MASFNMHLAIAKLYAERNGIKDTTSFLRGTIDPDLTDTKDATHYGVTPARCNDAWTHIENKVSLAKFLQENPIDNDLNLGRFLHLVVDLKFFHEFFGKKMMQAASKNEFSADLYHSYSLTSEHLVQHYNLNELGIDKFLDVSQMQMRIGQSQKLLDSAINDLKYSPKNIIPFSKLDKFIQDLASVDLENIAKRARKT